LNDCAVRHEEVVVCTPLHQAMRCLWDPLAIMALNFGGGAHAAHRACGEVALTAMIDRLT